MAEKLYRAKLKTCREMERDIPRNELGAKPQDKER